MYNIVRRTQKFDTDNQTDMSEYDEILNNPLCSIIVERKEKLRDEQYDEGKLISSSETILLVVTWDEKELA